MSPPLGTAAARWADELVAWAIPDHILAQAPESPWGYVPAMFKAGPGGSGPSLATQRALEALDKGGRVLDVGCGGGAAAFALVPPAGYVMGVDESSSMLELFATTAAERGVGCETVEGRWPDVAPRTPLADVVVCHNVLYNVAALVPFARALGAHSRTRVVVEITAAHPLTRQARYWKHFWDLDRPDGPTAELALNVLREAGIPARLAYAPGTERDASDVDRAAIVAFVRRRLCLGAERDAEIDDLLGDDLHGTDDRAVLWWDR